MAHTVHCAHDWCDQYSVRVSFRLGVDPAEGEAAHRRKLAEAGWTNVEGRDYCPGHKEES